MAGKIIVGGGTGFVGRHICKSLKQSNYTPLVVSRNPTGSNQLSWSDIQAKGLPKNVKVVINIAGEPVLNPLKRWNDNFQRSIHDSRIGTTTLLRNAIIETTTPPEVFIAMSTVGFYPADPTEVYNEDFIPSGSDYWTKLTTDWENAGKFPSSFDSVRHVIVRCGVVLEKDGGALQQMLPSFWIGLGGKYGNGKQWFPWIHAKDLAGIFLHAIENNHVHGVLNGVAPEATTNNELAKTLGVVMGRPSLIPLPGFVLQTMFGSPRSSMLLDGQNVYPQRTLDSGFNFKFPKLCSALEDIINQK